MRHLTRVWAALATLVITSSAAAVVPKTTSGAFGNLSAPRATDFTSQTSEAHPQVALEPGEVASDSSLASRAGTRIVRDFATKNTKNLSARFGSQGEARSLARTKLGRDPVPVEPGKLRSADGRWQYRGKPEDLAGHGPGDSPHIHLEHLNPKTGEVLENWHLRWD